VNLGETIVAVIDGLATELQLDDRVLPDRTCGQYDTGYWAGRPSDDDCNFFVSDDGIVYGENEGGTAFDKEIGRVVPNTSAEATVEQLERTWAVMGLPLLPEPYRPPYYEESLRNFHRIVQLAAMGDLQSAQTLAMLRERFSNSTERAVS
jgi:hypothetical protein